MPLWAQHHFQEGVESTRRYVFFLTLNLTPSSSTTKPCGGITSPSARLPLASAMANWTATVPKVPSSGCRTTNRVATLSLRPERDVGSLSEKCSLVLKEMTPCPSSLARMFTVALRKHATIIQSCNHRYTWKTTVKFHFIGFAIMTASDSSTIKHFSREHLELEVKK